MRCFTHQCAKGILSLRNAILQCRDSALQIVIVGLCLWNGSLIGHAAFFHSLHSTYVFGPNVNGGLRRLELLVEHLQGVVEVSYVGNDSRARSLFCSLGHFEVHLVLLLRITNGSHWSKLPTCSNRESVSLAGFVEVPTWHRALRLEGNAGVVGQTLHLQACLNLLNT